MSQTSRKTKIGVFGIGLAAYWPQFEGLKERLEGYQRYVEGRISELGAEVVSAGLVDTAPAAQAAGVMDHPECRSAGLLCGHLRHFLAGFASRATSPCASAHPQSATRGVDGLSQHRHWRMAGELLRLLCPRNLQRLCPQPHPV